MAVQISTHLQFDGRCRQAFETYRALFGGELYALCYADTPMAADVGADWLDRIVHATLRTGQIELSGSDIAPPDYRRPQGFAVLVTLDGEAEARRIFDALEAGGTVEYAFQETFWSPGYGMVVDAFGIPWEINTSRAGD